MLIRSIFDIGGFESLSPICERFNIALTLYGSTVRRLALLEQEGLRPVSEYPVHLFHIIPATSDIDLVHTGHANLTATVRDAIFEQVPFSEYFRWEIKSFEEHAPYREAMKYNGIIPANLMSLSSNDRSGIQDPWKGKVDLREKRLRYIRNGFYKDSPLYKQNADLEFFSALLYFKAVLSSGIPVGNLEMQPGFAEARQVLVEANGDGEVMDRLARYDQLRMRLYYLLATLFASTSSMMEKLQLRQKLGLDRWMSGKDTTSSMQSIFDANTFVISSYLGGDRFRCRIQNSDNGWAFGDDAQRLFKACCESYIRADNTRRKSPLQLDKNQKVLFASPPIHVSHGNSASSFGNEFIHVIGYLPSNAAPACVTSTQLGCVAVMSSTPPGQTAIVFAPLPSQIDLTHSMNTPLLKVVIRCNCHSLLESGLKDHQVTDATLSLFVVLLEEPDAELRDA